MEVSDLRVGGLWNGIKDKIKNIILGRELITLLNNYNETFTNLSDKIDRFWTIFPKVYSLPQHGCSCDKKTNFQLRVEHFQEEKNRIAELFIRTLFANSLFARDSESRKIILLIDSGSTTYAVFRALTDLYNLSDVASQEKMRDKIIIITNNVPGISYLMENARLGNSLRSNMALTCHVMPGEAEGKYSAILGDNTTEYVNNISGMLCSKICNIKCEKERNRSECPVISITSANYFSTKCGPMIRGSFHGDVKNAMAMVADKIYVLLPIGKILDITLDDLNNIAASAGKSYFCVFKNIPENDVTIITSSAPKTTFGDQRLFKMHDYFEAIQAKMDAKYPNIVKLKRFEPLLESQQAIMEKNLIDPYEAMLNYEFPHANIRDAIRVTFD